MPKNSPWMVTYNLEFVWILCIYFFHMDTDRYRHSLRLQHTQDCKRICDHQRCSRRMNLPNSCQCQWHIHQYLKWKSKYVETIQLAGCGAQITVHFPQYRVHEWYIRELKQDLIDSIAIARLIILTSYGLNVDVSIPQGKKRLVRLQRGSSITSKPHEKGVLHSDKTYQYSWIHLRSIQCYSYRCTNLLCLCTQNQGGMWRCSSRIHHSLVNKHSYKCTSRIFVLDNLNHKQEGYQSLLSTSSYSHIIYITLKSLFFQVYLA